MTTIQTIKEAEERFENKYGETFSESGLEISKSHIRQTLLAVFESELERKKGMFRDVYRLGISDNMQRKDKGYNSAIEEDISHLTEVINYLKQK